MATLRLEIVTPEATAYSEDVEMVTLPGVEGELGVYPNHVPLLTTLNPGELRVLKGGKETFLAIGEGFVEITRDVAAFFGSPNLLEARDGRVPALGVQTSGASDGTAILRPEDLEIGRPEESGTPARVDEVTFQGARLRLTLTLETGPRVVCAAPVADPAGMPRVDEHIVVRSRRGAVHAVAESRGATGMPVTPPTAAAAPS